MEEYWDVYDENRQFLNRTIRRGDPFGEGEYYVSCEIWIVNSNGEMLLTLRHPAKKAGGLWEFVGGGVLAGETTANAAAREVKEETGICVKESELHLLSEYRDKNCFMDIYLVKNDVDITDIALDENEATAAKWASKREIREMIDKRIFVRSVARRFQLFSDKI